MQVLKRLSNQELETNLKDLIQKERKLLHVILEHIKEIDSRRLYLERAYSSLYEYLIKEFGYSGSAAMRRIARLLKEVPAMAQKIQEGSLNLSQIGELSRSIKEKEKTTGQKVSSFQKRELVAKIENKTTPDTQKELALALDLPVKEFEKQKMHQDESLRLEITLSKEQYQKLLQCKDLAAHLLEQNHKDSSWASLFELLADQYLQKTFRKSHTENSKVETSKEDTATDVNSHDNAAQTNSATLSRTDAVVNDWNKTLTPKTRKLILKRDTCCQYRDPQTGKICRSTYGLQIDHKTSRWIGGSHEARNLQVLCGKHNRYKYSKEAGLVISVRNLRR
ncbi:HNH endonuclease signature motif containing protein [uncultured Bdellovibrio sp.]|uniref:HNH endonuclease signature motif containing protein n=1 Tax=Bdellovibrio sp. HCB-162 TaxID=3394234 RepID=UPI0025FE54C8|nr:HNH endonuclease signature motif containing protein [uncultured Bdellovibrio sp.]